MLKAISKLEKGIQDASAQADWTEKDVTKVAYIKNKPVITQKNLHTHSNLPLLETLTVKNGALVLKQNPTVGVTVQKNIVTTIAAATDGSILVYSAADKSYKPTHSIHGGTF